MKKLSLLFFSLLFITTLSAQDNPIDMQPVAPLPVKQLVAHPPYRSGPMNLKHTAEKTTSGSTFSDWYDLWDEEFDTTSTTLPHSYMYLWEIAPDSNIHDTYGYYAPYNLFTHGMGMSFDPSDSAYYYFPVDTAYRVSAPFDFTSPYELDSFWVPGEYMRFDTTSGVVDSLVIEFFVNQGTVTIPDSGAYALIATSANPMYYPFTKDETPRFVSPRYYRFEDECDSALTTVTHRRYAFPLKIADAFLYETTKFRLTSPVIVYPGHYIAAYVYFKPQISYPLGTSNYNANYYWLYAGEPRGTTTWFPQSSRNITTGYPGSHQQGLIATNQIRYSNSGFTFNSHNILLPASAYANTGANLPPGFTVPHMAFHINWPLPSLKEQPITQALPVEVFPNPANSQLEISFIQASNTEAKVSLINTFGQVVATQNTTAGSVTFNIASIPAGIYIYMLQTNGSLYTGRVFIVH